MIAAPEVPHNFEAEQALLGAILVNNSAYHRVGEFLRAEHFTDPLHGKLFDSVARLIERGQTANPVSLKTYVEHDETLKAVGGMAYIARLAASSVHALDAGEFGQLVYDLYLRRKLIELSEEMAVAAYRPTPELAATAQIEAVERNLYALSSTGSASDAKGFSAVLTAAVKEAEIAHRRGSGRSGISTGLRGLDQLLGGLHKSDLIILAGRPSMGKTALATNIAFNVARAFRQETIDDQPVVVDGAAVGFFSLEMSATQLANRIMSEQAGVASHKVRQGTMNSFEMDRYIDVVAQLQHMPIYIDDTGALSISALRTRARRMKRRHGIGLLIIDYLQLATGSGDRRDGRVQEVSEISRGLKALAKELDMPVLALSQLSREVEKRPDKHPQLADLRDSGTIEQDADVVMFVYREEYYLEKGDKKGSPEHIASMGMAEVNIAKQRHGPTGTVPLRFDGALTKFSDVPAADRHDGQ